MSIKTFAKCDLCGETNPKVSFNGEHYTPPPDWGENKILYKPVTSGFKEYSVDMCSRCFMAYKRALWDFAAQHKVTEDE